MKKDIDFIPRNQQDRILIYQTELLEELLDLLKPKEAQDKSEIIEHIKNTRRKRGDTNVINS